MPRGVHSNHRRGANHPRWNGDHRLIASTGYVKVRVGVGHPLADPNGYAYEHLVVWCAAGNRRPRAGEIIHHINGDKHDNRLENLRAETRAQHNRHHNTERRRDHRGRFVANGRLLDGREWNEFPEVRP